MRNVRSASSHISIIIIIIGSSHPRGLHLPRQTTCRAGILLEVPQSLSTRHYVWRGAETPRVEAAERRSSRQVSFQRIHQNPVLSLPHSLLVFQSTQLKTTFSKMSTTEQTYIMIKCVWRSPQSLLAACQLARTRDAAMTSNMARSRCSELPTCQCCRRAVVLTDASSHVTLNTHTTTASSSRARSRTTRPHS
jgi:hypothetical protein